MPLEFLHNKKTDITPTLCTGVFFLWTRIGEKIKERRKFLKIKKGDLADIAGISERTLREIEKGAANPELNSLLQICEVHGLKMQLHIIT